MPVNPGLNMPEKDRTAPDLTIKKIDSISLFLVRLPLRQPFTTSFGTDIHKDALLVSIQGNDCQGWGECVASPDPYYSYETNATAMVIIKKYLTPMIRTRQNHPINDLLGPFKTIRGHHMAKAAVENALLDLAARQSGRSLYELIGGKPKKIMSGISIGIQEDLPVLLNIIGDAHKKKYHRIKIKIKKGKDIDILKGVRGVFPDIPLMVDANADYSIEDLEVLKQFDEFDLMMIEQPLGHDDLYFHSLVQRELKTPICLDESIKNLDDAKAAVEMKSCRVINIKQGRVGGIVAARDIQQHCLENCISCWSGGMLETGIGRAFNLHLQTLPGFSLPGDTSETSRYFHEDIVDKPVVLDENGFIDLPQGPGTGVEVVAEKLKQFTIFSENIL